MRYSGFQSLYRDPREDCPLPPSLSFLLRHLAASESGVTAIEYGLVVCLISVACISALTTIGQWIQDIFLAAAAAMT